MGTRSNILAWRIPWTEAPGGLSPSDNRLKILKVLVAQSCLTLCDSGDCSPPGASVHGILQARTLEWGAISSSRGSSRPRD